MDNDDAHITEWEGTLKPLVEKLKAGEDSTQAEDLLCNLCLSQLAIFRQEKLKKLEIRLEEKKLETRLEELRLCNAGKLIDERKAIAVARCGHKSVVGDVNIAMSDGPVSVTNAMKHLQQHPVIKFFDIKSVNKAVLHDPDNLVPESACTPLDFNSDPERTRYARLKGWFERIWKEQNLECRCDDVSGTLVTDHTCRLSGKTDLFVRRENGENLPLGIIEVKTSESDSLSQIDINQTVCECVLFSCHHARIKERFLPVPSLLTNGKDFILVEIDMDMEKKRKEGEDIAVQVTRLDGKITDILYYLGTQVFLLEPEETSRRTLLDLISEVTGIEEESEYDEDFERMRDVYCDATVEDRRVMLQEWLVQAILSSGSGEEVPRFPTFATDSSRKKLLDDYLKSKVDTSIVPVDITDDDLALMNRSPGKESNHPTS
jgi:hypothetical protein